MGQISIEQVAARAREIQNEHAFAADADASFDGGEWSSSAHDRAEERAITQLAELHGYAYDDVMGQLAKEDHEAFLAEVDACDARILAGQS